MEGSGEGDVNITGDEHDEDVPGNSDSDSEKKDEEKLDDVDAVHRGIVWPDKWPYNSHPPTSKIFINDWQQVDRNRNMNTMDIDYKPEFYAPPPPPVQWVDPEPDWWHEPPSVVMPPVDPPKLIEYPTSHSSPLAAGGGGSVMLLLVLAAKKWCGRSRPSGTVLATGVVGPPAAQTDMTPPGQEEADPLYIDMPPPYSDCNNMDVNEEPARGSASEPLTHNDNLVEIGFKNECGAMTTTTDASGDVNTEFVSDNDRTVERLSENESAHGTRSADDRDNVMFVDEKSMPNQGKYN